MLRQLIIDKLKQMNLKYEEVPGSEWIKCQCTNPNHHDNNPSAGVNVVSGILHCFSCGHNELFIKSDSSNPEEAADLIWNAKYQNYKRQVQDTYPDFDSIAETQKDRNKELFLPPIDHKLTEEWRGLSPELLADAEAYACTHGKYRGRYVFPFYEDGKVYGFDARIVDASANMVGAKWIRNRGAPVKDLVYPKDVLLKRFADLSHIVVCEGVADALSYIQMGVPAIASFGLTAPSPHRIETLIRIGVEKITLAFDNDEAGRKGMLDVLPYYQEWFEVVPHSVVLFINNSGYKDANEFLEGVKTNGIKQDTGYEDDGRDL